MRHISNTRLATLFSAFFVCLAMLFTACEVEESDMAEDEITENEIAEDGMDDTDMDGLEPGVSVGDLEGDPAEYIGQTVTVDGEVDELYGQNAFTIEGGLFSGDLLVIVPPDVQMAATFDDDTEVQVTGEVIEYVQVELEGMYDWDFDYGMIDYEEREPVLIAQQIMAVSDEMAAEEY